jgi:hypothetical protein
MSDWPIFPNYYTSKWYPVIDGGSTYYTQVDTANAANTKGNYTQIIASTPCDCFLVLQITRFANVGDFLIDIAVGGAGSESIIVSDILFSRANALQFGLVQSIPIPKLIPSGTRVSIRCQSTRASTNSIYLNICCNCLGNILYTDLNPKITTYGSNTADSGGTGLDPGGVANTKSAWVEISSSLTFETSGLFLGIGSRNNATTSTCSWSLDLAVGGAGSEQIIISSIIITIHGNNNLINPGISDIYWVSIPAGTRLAARVQSNITDASDRLIDIIVYTIS